MSSAIYGDLLIYLFLCTVEQLKGASLRDKWATSWAVLNPALSVAFSSLCRVLSTTSWILLRFSSMLE